MAHTRLVEFPGAWLVAMACLAVGCGAPEAPAGEAADLDIDGALGTAWLLLGPVTLDLRGEAAR